MDPDEEPQYVGLHLRSKLFNTQFVYNDILQFIVDFYYTPKKIIFIPPKFLFWGVYWNQPVGRLVGWLVCRAGGWSVCKFLYIQLLLQFQPERLDTCHKC